jgi:hypothetical protein
MKGLIQAGIIIAALIAVGFITSVAVTNNLDGEVAAAREEGFEEGYARGYASGCQEGSRAGYQDGSKVGYGDATGEDYSGEHEEGFHFLYNPTYDEVWEILSRCEVDSAWGINNAAEDEGVRAIYVRCELDDDGRTRVAEMVAFETVDKGLIFIEPSSGQEVRLEVGRAYSEINGLSDPGYDGVITEVQIVW